ncbi:MAG TPA: sigma-70 family RNA polymerase sigma factor [Burkholderiales bacterium]|nr:sigma-70 family RNA polymerase sigma factor [Burkholderiales bacterium]
MHTDADQLAQHRDYLVRFARVHLRDPARAEDVVQETLLAAMENRAGFSGKAQLRTWLTGILKHKIIDVFRRQKRDAPDAGVDDLGPEADEAFADLYFDAGREDHWRSAPPAWGDPERSLEQKRFWEVFDACSKQMPAQTARVFLMRELMGLETEEICKELGITPNNCWVLLYRARMNLRQCLEARWFADRA